MQCPLTLHISLSAHNSRRLIFQDACCLPLFGSKFFPCICPETACTFSLPWYFHNHIGAFKQTAFRMLCFHIISLYFHLRCRISALTEVGIRITSNEIELVSVNLIEIPKYNFYYICISPVYLLFFNISGFFGTALDKL